MSLRHHIASMLAVCLLPFYLVPGSLSAAEGELNRFTYTAPHMGTEFKIILYAANQREADKASKAAFERIAELDRIMSDYRPTSELMQLCQKAGGEPVKVSKELFAVLSKAEEVSKLSDGAFDVTVGPVVKLWRLSFRSQRMPDKEKLAKALALVGYQRAHLNSDARTVKLDKAGMQLDLGGIAKGYAADEALAVLKNHSIDRALVAASGDIAVSGPPPDAEGWRIAIAPLEGSKEKPDKTIYLHDAAVSTSGDTEKYVEIDGKRYSHIVDPRTGLGLTDRMSVTVIARRGIMADSLTKVVCILGPEKGIPLIEKGGGIAAFMVRRTDTGVESFTSKGFTKKFERK